MSTFLFRDIIFGPVRSRRLGISLGINLLPNDYKFCNFNCIYCECGLTGSKNINKNKLHLRENVKLKLNEKLQLMQKNNEPLDVITFAGNGEPTLHPEFDKIIDDTIEIRNKYFPKARIAVLSNATTIHKEKVFNAFLKIDDNILKLDSAFEKTIKLLNNPIGSFGLDSTINNLKKFKGNFILQTMFVRGKYNDIVVDNTTKKEVEAWLSLLPELNPRLIMIYTIARDTPVAGLEKISVNELNKIAEKAINMGYKVQVSG